MSKSIALTVFERFLAVMFLSFVVFAIYKETPAEFWVPLRELKGYLFDLMSSIDKLAEQPGVNGEPLFGVWRPVVKIVSMVWFWAMLASVAVVMVVLVCIMTPIMFVYLGLSALVRSAMGQMVIAMVERFMGHSGEFLSMAYTSGWTWIESEYVQYPLRVVESVFESVLDVLMGRV